MTLRVTFVRDEPHSLSERPVPLSGYQALARSAGINERRPEKQRLLPTRSPDPDIARTTADGDS
ncbi:hypothetical protein ANO14919_076430 [Xylariales sp. No.14919]|nr:hypothetical protein ANO14919_076430 [Xylariales sp. No.14919]